MLNRRHCSLLEARGLDIELLERLGVSSSERLGPDTIAIPYFRGEEAVGVKYRTIAGEKRFAQDPGSQQILYNRNCLNDPTLAHMPIVITEGEVDCWSALQSGFPRSVSVPAGAPATTIGDRATAKYDFIDDMPGEVAKAVIVIAADADDPGAALRADLALRFGSQRCKWVKYPRGCKDLNEALQRYGQRGVVETLNRAQWIVGHVYRMADIPPLVPAAPYESGFPGLDEHYRLRIGDLAVVTGIPSHGKALALDTPIPTPSGWRAMGDLRVGDNVFDEQGLACRITNATPAMIGRPCFRVQFSDGSELIADAEHQWITVSEKARRSSAVARMKRGERQDTKPKGTDQRHKRTYPSVVTTIEISRTLRSQGKWNHQVDNARPLELPPVELPISPYVLGTWLGDGTSSAGQITCFDDGILLAVGSEGYVTSKQKTPGVYTIRGIQPELRSLGILGNKYIPASYLRGSKNQRLALLRGLMDTDGHCARNGTCEFTTVNQNLADGVYELICSLGCRASRYEGRAFLNGKDCGVKYRIQFTPAFAAFTLDRKASRQRYAGQYRSKTSYRTIMGCSAIPSVPVRCIEVDSRSHLYLAGRSMIPTHNSAFVNDIACRMALRHRWPVCFASFEQTPQIDHKRLLRSWFGGGIARDLDSETQERADRWIEELFAFVVPDAESYPTLPWVMERLAAAAIRFGARLFVIDPWNELEHDRPPSVSITEYVGAALRDLKAFARKYEAHLMVVAHPAKLHRENGKYPIPSLYDISDSSHWYNKADVGIVVHRKSDEETLIRVAKSRYHDQIGKPGDVSVRYVWQRATYVAAEPRE